MIAPTMEYETTSQNEINVMPGGDFAGVPPVIEVDPKASSLTAELTLTDREDPSSDRPVITTFQLGSSHYPAGDLRVAPSDVRAREPDGEASGGVRIETVQNGCHESKGSTGLIAIRERLGEKAATKSHGLKSVINAKPHQDCDLYYDLQYVREAGLCGPMALDHLITSRRARRGATAHGVGGGRKAGAKPGLAGGGIIRRHLIRNQVCPNGYRGLRSERKRGEPEGSVNPSLFADEEHPRLATVERSTSIEATGSQLVSVSCDLGVVTERPEVHG